MATEVKPFMSYVGGKRWLARRIISMLPDHTCYVEPFGGMGAVLLAKQPSKVEVWNDIDGGLANVMRIVKYHPDALEHEMQWMLYHRGDRELWRIDHPGYTDIQRAARWIMVRRAGFQGRAGTGFYVSRTTKLAARGRLVDRMNAVSQRLSGTVIECLPWQRVIDLYDAPATVFFLDPPYADGDQSIYSYGFSEPDHLSLRERLRNLAGRWILTYGDHPLIRDIYADCRIQEVHRMRLINVAARRQYTELIITP